MTTVASVDEHQVPTSPLGWRVRVLTILLVASLAALAVGGYARSIDPARPGTSHRVTLQMTAPCLRVMPVHIAGRIWDSVDRAPPHWPPAGPVVGTLRVVASDQGVFEADIGGTANYHRLPDGLVFPDQSCPIS
jgi:hypothetical protein